MYLPQSNGCIWLIWKVECCLKNKCYTNGLFGFTRNNRNLRFLLDPFKGNKFRYDKLKYIYKDSVNYRSKDVVEGENQIRTEQRFKLFFCQCDDLKKISYCEFINYNKEQI